MPAGTGLHCTGCAQRVYRVQRADGTQLLVTSYMGSGGGRVHCTPAPLTRAQRRAIARRNRR